MRMRGSLSRTVTTPGLLPIFPLLGAESRTWNDSSDSATRSPTTGTAIVFVHSPGANISLPATAR
jgi:hypothetical protein